MVYEYALKRGYLEEAYSSSPLILDFIMIMTENDMIHRDQEIDIQKELKELEVQFLDWFLLERNFHNQQTIGELYIESEDFKHNFDFSATKELKRIIRALKEPIWSYFVVFEKEDKGQYWVEQLDTTNTFLVHDKSTFAKFKVGAVFYAKLIPFDDLYFLGCDPLVVPEKEMKKINKVKKILESLDDNAKEFMKGKAGTKPKTQQKYWEMFPLLQEYVTSMTYTKPSQVKNINVDTMMKWASETFYLSRWNETQYSSAAKQFIKYLSKIESWE